MEFVSYGKRNTFPFTGICRVGCADVQFYFLIGVIVCLLVSYLQCGLARCFLSYKEKAVCMNVPLCVEYADLVDTGGQRLVRNGKEALLAVKWAEIFKAAFVHDSYGQTVRIQVAGYAYVYAGCVFILCLHLYGHSVCNRFGQFCLYAFPVS